MDSIETRNPELLTRYGKIDILRYDVAWPMTSSKTWDSPGRNQRLRAMLKIVPKPDGSIPAYAIQTLYGVGEWLGRNGQCLYGPKKPADGQGMAKRRGSCALFFFLWGPSINENPCRIAPAGEV